MLRTLRRVVGEAEATEGSMVDGTGSKAVDARRRSRSAMLAAAALVLIVAAVACRPMPMGSAGATLGNDVVACPQRQPSNSPPCGPQPMLWAAITGPYEVFANGDPYTTKCGRNLVASVAACSSGTYPGGATNELYDPTGYEYAIEVGPEDVGNALTFQIYDAGSYQRSTGAPTTQSTTVTTTNGSVTLNRTGGTNFSAVNVGKAITGTGIPAGTIVSAYVNANQVTISQAALSSGSNRVVTITTPPDCNSNAAPFNSPPYISTTWSSQHCQTGDAGSTPIQVQVFENDGNPDDDEIAYDAAIPACHLHIPAGTGATTYKNAWATVCSFVPTAAGVYPVRIKSSAIVLPDGTALTDTGSGYNGFALRVTGGTTTRVHQIDQLSIWLNTLGTNPHVYLTEITTEDAGKQLQLDLFDAGDGNSGEYTLQVLAPPSGAPGTVPTGGTVIPAPGYADSCRYNPTASPTRGPDVAEPNGVPATDCRVTTKFASVGSGVYNNGWLSIEIEIADDYTCDTDCWWTVKYDFGTSGSPGDRTVWTPVLVDAPLGADGADA